MSRQWGNAAWGRETKKRRLAQAREAMDAIDEKFKKAEAEQYLDPDKGFAELREPGEKRPTYEDKDAVKRFEGEFAFLAPGYATPVAPADEFGPRELDGAAVAAPYPSLEHAFQAVRAGAPAAPARQAIRAAADARAAKGLGSKAFHARRDADAFKARSVDAMEALLRDKFARAAPLRQRLLDDTGGRRLRHGNDFNDLFWGLKDGKDPKTGRNELGLAHERVRALAKDEAAFWLRWAEDRAPRALDARDSAFDAAWRREGDAKLQRLAPCEEVKAMLVGRHGACGLQVDHASCSRFHAAVVNAAPADDDTCVVVDLGASHGTFVQRKALGAPVRLEPFVFYHVEKRDEIRFGESSKWFRFIADRRRRARKAERLAGRMAATPDDEAARTVRITSLAYEADESDLRHLFRHVEGAKVRIQYESEASKRHRGVAYALLPDRRAVTAALACDLEEVRGRRVRVRRLDAEAA